MCGTGVFVAYVLLWAVAAATESETLLGVWVVTSLPSSTIGYFVYLATSGLFSDDSSPNARWIPVALLIAFMQAVLVSSSIALFSSIRTRRSDRGPIPRSTDW